MQPLESRLLSKLVQHRWLIDNGVMIRRGILTGCDSAFIIDGAKCRELVAKDPRCKEILRPTLKGSDISRYHFRHNDRYLITTHSGSRTMPPVSLQDYDAIAEHLGRYERALNGRSDKGITPFHLRSCGFMDDFYEHKIIYQEICSTPSFAYDSEGYMLLNSAYMLLARNKTETKLLLALLNSKLLWWYLSCNNVSIGRGIRMLAMCMETIPIIMPSGEDASALIELVDAITLAKSTSEDANTSKLEADIDAIVYKLYGLDSEEIAFVEKA